MRLPRLDQSVNKKIKQFLIPLRQQDPLVDSLSLDFDSFDINDTGKTLSRLRIDRSIKKVNAFHGGTKEAEKHLQVFLESNWIGSRN